MQPATTDAVMAAVVLRAPSPVADATDAATRAIGGQTTLGWWPQLRRKPSVAAPATAATDPATAAGSTAASAAPSATAYTSPPAAAAAEPSLPITHRSGRLGHHQAAQPRLLDPRWRGLATAQRTARLGGVRRPSGTRARSEAARTAAHRATASAKARAQPHRRARSTAVPRGDRHARPRRSQRTGRARRRSSRRGSAKADAPRRRAGRRAA